MVGQGWVNRVRLMHIKIVRIRIVKTKVALIGPVIGYIEICYRFLTI